MSRPYVICHMGSTIDGKILTKRWGVWRGAKSVGKLYETTAKSYGVGAWLVGTTTMKEFADGVGGRLPKARGKVPAGDFIARLGAKTFAIGVDAKGVLRYKHPEVDGDHVVLLVSAAVGQDYLAHLRAAGVSYLICGKSRVDLGMALRKLREAFGLRKLMLEGGGLFNGSMLAEGLVDEVSQIIVPVVDGGGEIPGLFQVEGGTKKALAELRLVKSEVMDGGMVWNRYRVMGAK